MKNNRQKLLMAFLACLLAMTARLDARTVEIRMAYGGVPGVTSMIAAHAGACPSVINNAIALRVRFHFRSIERRVRRGRAASRR